MVTFETAFDRTIGIEAGYVNDLNDPGGETKWGISKRSYPTLNIAALSRDDAKVIYRRDFWEPCASFLHDAILYQAFDAAFHHGIGNAIRMVQHAIGVTEDGHFGAVSQQALAAMPEIKVAFRFLAARLRFMKSLTKWATYSRGWAERIAIDLDYAAQDM